MARKSASTIAASTAAPVVSVSVTPAAAEAPATKVSRKPKAAAPVASAPVVVEPTPVVEPAVGASATHLTPVAEEVASLQTRLADFGSKIQQIGALHSALKTEYKVLEKTIAREMKQAAKASGARKRASGNKQPSGFVKPSQISDELIKFLGKEAGTMMSRVEVSKEISAYITANGLKDKANGRLIHADAKLSKLLKLSAADSLNFFNLQKYLKPHFIKAVPAPATA